MRTAPSKYTLHPDDGPHAGVAMGSGEDVCSLLGLQEGTEEAERHGG